MIFELFVKTIFDILTFLISLIPKIDLGGLDTSLDWIFRSFSQFAFVVQALNYIAGFPIVPIIFGVFIAIFTIEFTISLIWFSLHKTHIAGGGH